MLKKGTKMRKTTFLLILVLVLLLLSSTALPWDGQRKGFILGFGAGPGITSFQQDIAVWDFDRGWIPVKIDRQSKPAVMTNFKIGYSPDSQWEVYYSNKTSWFRAKDVSSHEVSVADGLHSLGASYYFHPQAPSVFVSSGIGMGMWVLPFESHPPHTWLGLGLFTGVGYELAPHMEVELDFFWVNPGRFTQGIDEGANSFSLKLTFNVTGY